MNGLSFFTDRPTDKKAVYFDEESFEIKSDGTVDVSEQLQDAIYRVSKQAGYGVLFVPSGTYLLSRTIYVPKAVRIIGYGASRPEFVLQDNAPGFDKENKDAKGNCRYLFWFVNSYYAEMTEANDANPGTFYSAMSNVNVSLGKGNDYAVAFRTNYAQHCFLSHIDINIMSGMAGIYDVGNEIEDIRFVGGKYGIISTKCSPGWPFVMVDTRFLGQTYACIKCHEVGLNIIRTHAENTANFLEVDDNYFEKVYMEDSIFEDMNCVLQMAMDNNSLTQVNIRNCYLKGVENIVRFKDTDRKIANEDYQCKVKSYIHGITVSDNYPEKQMHDQIYRYAKDVDYKVLESDCKTVPPVSEWTNVLEVGLKGDGVSDDTQALKKAIEQYRVIYFPQGEYLLSNTIKLRDDTVLIGMNPISTKLILKDNAEKFTGFGKCRPFIESGLKNNTILGIGIETGGRNPRACGLKWICQEEGYINDVKFFGGHGDLEKITGNFKMPYDEGRARDACLEKRWDYQYPSLVIAEGGGGTIKDIWSASPYVSAGVLIKDTSTQTKIYCMSLEHHARCELRMINSSNITIYGFQSEEEKAEGEFAQPIELHNCNNITFATTYFFRTVFVQKKYPYCVKTWNCENIKFLNVHNYSQMKYTIENLMLDVSSGLEIRPWQAAVIKLTKSPKRETDAGTILERKGAMKLYSGFQFADGGCCNGKGDFYFLDSLDKKVYKIDGESLELSMFFESPFKINSIGFDTRDNIIIVGEYTIPLGATWNGNEIRNELPVDSYGTSYGFWYDKRAYVVAFSVDEKGEIEPLSKIKIGDINPQRVLYPGNRWRDSNDFAQVLLYNPEYAFIGLDNATIIPCHYDLIRANNLARSKPGRKLYSVDEMYKRVYQCDILENGLLANPLPIIEEGDFRVKKYNDKIYVGDDQIKIYESKKCVGSIDLPQRPTTFDFGGRKKNILFVTSRDSIYAVKE